MNFFKKVWFKLIRFTKELFTDNDIVFHFTISRATGVDESFQITFNGRKKDNKEDLEQRIDLVGELLQNRMRKLNDQAIEIGARIKEEQAEKLKLKMSNLQEPEVEGNA